MRVLHSRLIPTRYPFLNFTNLLLSALMKKEPLPSIFAVSSSNMLFTLRRIYDFRELKSSRSLLIFFASWSLLSQVDIALQWNQVLLMILLAFLFFMYEMYYKLSKPQVSNQQDWFKEEEKQCGKTKEN